MGRLPSFQPYLDEVPQLSISELKRRGCFGADQTEKRDLMCNTRGGSLGAIRLTVSIPERYVELNNLFGEKPHSYRVVLEPVAKHFGGHEWYFICPQTKRRCRTLYCFDDLFLSRYAYPTALYGSQARSKSDRLLMQAFNLVNSDMVFHRKPHAREIYDGKLTKRYERFLNKLNRINLYGIFEYIGAERKVLSRIAAPIERN